MEYFAQQLINGLPLGSIYGLIAIGYTMVYGIVGMINFAHGEVFMIGAFIALLAMLCLFALGVTWVPLALLLALLISMALTAAWGWTIERIAYRPLRSPFRLAGLPGLGYAAFYAAGACTYALMATHLGWPFWVCLPLAGLFAAPVMPRTPLSQQWSV